jgi:hypothetical protein
MEQVSVPLTPSAETPFVRLVDIFFTMRDRQRLVSCRVTKRALDALHAGRMSFAARPDMRVGGLTHRIERIANACVADV